MKPEATYFMFSEVNQKIMKSEYDFYNSYQYNCQTYLNCWEQSLKHIFCATPNKLLHTEPCSTQNHAQQHHFADEAYHSTFLPNVCICSNTPTTGRRLVILFSQPWKLNKLLEINKIHLQQIIWQKIMAKFTKNFDYIVMIDSTLW